MMFCPLMNDAMKNAWIFNIYIIVSNRVRYLDRTKYIGKRFCFALKAI